MISCCVLALLSGAEAKQPSYYKPLPINTKGAQ